MGQGQIKIVADAELLKNFKQIVLIKHGRLELGPEGEEAIRLYVQKHWHLLSRIKKPEYDPLNEVIGVLESREKRNALSDRKMLDSGRI